MPHPYKNQQTSAPGGRIERQSNTPPTTSTAAESPERGGKKGSRITRELEETYSNPVNLNGNP